MKKRIISLVLAVLMVLSLAACGEKPAATPSTAATTEATTAATTEAAPDTTATPITEEPTEAPTEAPAVPDNQLALGVVEGNAYINTYAGIAFDLDSTWTYLTADGLQDLSTVNQQQFEGTPLEEAMANVTQFTDFMAESSEISGNVNVLFQKLDMQQRIAYAMLDEKAVLDATLEQKDVMIQTYSQIGINVTSIEIVTINFCGQEHFALKTVGDIQGYPVYFLQAFDFWLGQYSMTITATAVKDDTTADLLSRFYAIE